MESKWSDADARAAIDEFVSERCNEDVALRVYTSRLIGRDARLVLHGGGNTSVKTRVRDDLGDQVDALCVKGSGWDLGDIEPPGLPAVRLEPLLALRRLPGLSDEDMVNAMRTRLLDASAPNPSVETLLHAFLPHKFIDHSHADAILALVDQPEAESICAEVFGDRLAIVPYVMPGFALAKLAAEVYEANPESEGLLLLQHGLFTYGDTARVSYERHIEAVRRAEEWVAGRPRPASPPPRPDVSYRELAPVLRGRLGEGLRRYVLTLRQSDEIRRFVDDPALASLARRGPVTPDHVIRTKRFPLILDAGGLEGPRLAEAIDRALGDYRDEYRDYVDTQRRERGASVTPLDPDPRVVLVPGLGLVAAGANAKAARVAADIYEHTIPVIRDAEAAGTYRALGDGDIFDMEYWSLEQAKLGKAKPPPLAGRVVVVTGAASGIGAAAARSFAGAGAHLHLLDRDGAAAPPAPPAASGPAPARSSAGAGAHLHLLDRDGAALETVASDLSASCDAVDVTDSAAVDRAFDRAVALYGGIDGVVSNAGTAPQAPIDACPEETLRGSFEINLFAHQWVAAAAVRILRAQGIGGFLLFNASKAAFNPGERFGPYAIAKAALVALMKQYALECGGAGIRANAVNADRIRTGLLPPAFVEERARARGLDPDAYFRSNLLKREVTAEDVGQAFLSLALAESTTGAVVTVDGGNIAASPR